MWAGDGTKFIQAAYDDYNIKVMPCFVSPQETGGHCFRSLEQWSFLFCLKELEN